MLIDTSCLFQRRTWQVIAEWHQTPPGVAETWRARERQGDERPANGQDNEDEKHAVRLEAHGLWRLQGHG